MGKKRSQLRDQAVKERAQALEEALQFIKNQIDGLKLKDRQMRQIGGMTVTQAVAKLNSLELTSKALVLALCYRAGTVGVKLNLITQINFKEALQMADICDKKRVKSGLKNWTFSDPPYNQEIFLPPLFGIPISVKDMFDMQGLMTTMGSTNRLKVLETDSPIVTCFKKSGIIPFVKSNCPQLGLAFQSVNDIWGRGSNPWNESRTCGGSSGGEGGLIAARCSLLGVGSDLGGSLRIPAQFCGIFSLKPSSKRISSKYHAKISDDFASFNNNINLSLGPLGHSAEDLALFMKVATTQNFYSGTQDPYTHIIPFDDFKYQQQKTSKKKLRIGYLKDLKICQPTVSSSRAFQQVIKILQEEGHQLIDVELPNEKQLSEVFFKELFATGCKNIKQLFDGEKPIQQSKNLVLIGSLIQPFRGILNFLSKMFMPRLYSYLLKNAQAMSTLDYQKHTGKIVEYRAQWINYWRQKQLDFIISPGFGSQAVKHGFCEFTSLLVAYTGIWNVLDMVVGAMPVTRVLPTEENYNTIYDDICAKKLKENAKDSQGLPVGVQIIGAPFSEERVLGLMSRLENKINFYLRHPLPRL